MKATRRRRAGKGDPAIVAVEALRRSIYALVRRIPRGKVATYGQVAELAGRPGAARMVGAALKVSTPAMGLPWQRVVGSKGQGQAKVNILDPIGGAMQRAMLEAEGVRFTASGAISLADHGWLPKRRTARRPRRAVRR